MHPTLNLTPADQLAFLADQFQRPGPRIYTNLTLRDHIRGEFYLDTRFQINHPTLKDAIEDALNSQWTRRRATIDAAGKLHCSACGEKTRPRPLFTDFCRCPNCLQTYYIPMEWETAAAAPETEAATDPAPAAAESC